jgi:hypothetical protein
MEETWVVTDVDEVDVWSRSAMFRWGPECAVVPNATTAHQILTSFQKCRYERRLDLSRSASRLRQISGANGTKHFSKDFIEWR